MPLSALGATIAALVEVAALTGANTGPDEPTTALSMISTLGVLTRADAGDLPTVFVPEPLVDASGAAHREHRRPRATRLHTPTRCRRGRTPPLREGTERRRRLAAGIDLGTGRRTGSGLRAVPDDPR
ncbi:hypothetical protein R1X32_49195 [Rhodococcus opacus]|uniref:hypothetical protein n=1 Tax=Rhodococcus opacus TaxID=37919 RepID=UPI0034D311A7